VGVELPVGIVEVERWVGVHHVHVGLVERADRSDIPPVAFEEVGLHAARVDTRRDDVVAEVDQIVAERVDQSTFVEQVDAHRSQIRTVGADAAAVE
jgi:hypothetical protein